MDEKSKCAFFLITSRTVFKIEHVTSGPSLNVFRTYRPASSLCCCPCLGKYLVGSSLCAKVRTPSCWAFRPRDWWLLYHTICSSHCANSWTFDRSHCAKAQTGCWSRGHELPKLHLSAFSPAKACYTSVEQVRVEPSTRIGQLCDCWCWCGYLSTNASCHRPYKLAPQIATAASCQPHCDRQP